MDEQIFRKKLLYKSVNCGWKENDILLGEFARKNIDYISSEELLMLDQLLKEPDVDIFNWITQKTEVPIIFTNSLMHKLQNFKLRNN